MVMTSHRQPPIRSSASRRWTAGLLACVAMGAALVIATGGSDGAQSSRSGEGALSAHSESSGCPDDALRLPPHAVIPAIQAALDAVPEIYGEEGHDPTRVNGAVRDDENRGITARRQCGSRAWHRTVVVYLFFPKLRFSASLSQGVVFVSRFKDGYHVWEAVH